MMNRRSVSAALLWGLSLAVLTTVAVGCGRVDGVPTLVGLPDLSTTDAFVGEQIRAQHASLTATTQATGVGSDRLAAAYGEMGTLLMAAALFDAAEPYLVEAQTLEPDATRWPYYLGHLYRMTGALPQSITAFESVLALRADDSVALLSLGDVYLLQGRSEDAEAVYRRQLSLQPDSVVATVGLGRAALAEDEYAQAVEHLEEGWRLSQQTAVGIHYPLALAYRGLGELEKVEMHLQQRADVAILPEDPLMEGLSELLESPRAYEQRGNRALTRRDWATAADYFREGLALDPNDPTLRHRLGTALFQMGDPHGATAHFEQIVKTSPDFALAHFSLGVLLEGEGRRTEAVERFEAAVRHDPSYVEARLGLASLLRRQGRFDESLAQYEQVMEDGVTGDPRVEEAPFGHAITLVRVGRYHEARDRLVAAMTSYPGQPFFVHALARLLSGAPDDDVRDGARALTILSALPEPGRRVDLGESMAMALAETGQFAEATTWQQEAINRATQGGRDDLVAGMRAKLDFYGTGRPWRHADPIEFDPFLERSAGAIR